MYLENNGITAGGCQSLAALLENTNSNLEWLDLGSNNMGDEGTLIFANAMARNCKLKHLNLKNNIITTRGCQSLVTLLENTHSNLKWLSVSDNNIGDEGARIFAKGLARNNKLEILDLENTGFTGGLHSAFSKVLCDTSSINSTFLSNHTLERLGWGSSADVRSLLAPNKGKDKKHVAIKKILLYHDHFDMQPFFEWDLKVLPIAINWFERAGSIDFNDALGIYRRKLGRRKLEVIYQFICALPEVFEPAPATAGGKRKRGAAGGRA